MSNLKGQIAQAQMEEEDFLKTIALVEEGKLKGFARGMDGLWRFKGRVCVPASGDLQRRILEEAHKSHFTMHPDVMKMYQDGKKMFWWPRLKKNIVELMSKCLVCQKVEIEHQKPSGILQPLEIPKWKWESISMDFMMGLPRMQAGLDAIWVIVDRLTKSAHFLPIRATYPLEKLAQLYVQEIVRLHDVPSTIILDKDPRFTSRLWGALQKAFGTRLCLSIAYHP